ncbi:alpha/beta hydrolase [Weissella minor]|uniref:alpha/beta hydrolase n=1 Tax=Weissella minor TaxID=1620 RepID=UPI003AF25E82
MAISNEAKILYEKLQAMHYREQLMQTFSNNLELPENQRAKSTNFPKKVQQHMYQEDGYDVLTVWLDEKPIKGDLMMLHGGAFIMPISPAFNQLVVQFLKCGYRVCLPDYPLAPTALSQSRAWLLKVYRKWFEQSEGSHFLFGESAGANLALRLLLDLERQEQPCATELLSICPDLSFMASPEVIANDLILDADIMRTLQGYAALADFDFKTLDENKYVGSVHFDTGGNECNVPAVKQLTQQLAYNEKNDITVTISDGMIHDFMLWQMLPEAKEAIKAVDVFFQKNHLLTNK